MMNNKGQAFSVFQLLIAAIVAVAILGVLFSVMSQVTVGPAGDADTEISNALSAAKQGSIVETQTFKMSRGNSLKGTDFEDILPYDTILFYIDTDGLKEGANGFEVEDRDTGEEVFSVVEYNGAATASVKARVICELTGERLQAELDSIDDLEIEGEGGECLDGDSGISPCCAVILKRG